MNKQIFLFAILGLTMAAYKDKCADNDLEI